MQETWQNTNFKMNEKIKLFFIYVSYIFILFAIDRVTKFQVLAILESQDKVDIYVNSFLNTSGVPCLGKKLKTYKSRTIFHKNKPIWVFLKNKLLSISSSEIRKNQTYT